MQNMINFEVDDQHWQKTMSGSTYQLRTEIWGCNGHRLNKTRHFKTGKRLPSLRYLNSGQNLDSTALIRASVQRALCQQTRLVVV